MAGARHIVSRVRINGEKPDPRTLEQDIAQERMGLLGKNNPTFLATLFNANQTMFALEFMKHGDVSHWLEKIGDRDLRLKSEELWKIFHCRKRNPCLSIFT